MAGQTQTGLTLWDMNIKFNYDLPYYSMSRSDNGVVTKRCLITKPNRRRFNV